MSCEDGKEDCKCRNRWNDASMFAAAGATRSNTSAGGTAASHLAHYIQNPRAATSSEHVVCVCCLLISLSKCQSPIDK
jgi:hypothetical protein